MAVYTRFPILELKEFLKDYSIGEFEKLEEIAQGVENSNYFLTTSKEYAVLTLFEKRTDPADLPFFLSLTNHLWNAGIPCPLPLKRNDGSMLGTLAQRPAVIISFLRGQMKLDPGPKECYLLGEVLANMHQVVADFEMVRENNLSTGGWQKLWNDCHDKSAAVLDCDVEWVCGTLKKVVQQWPTDLPSGVIHADLFTDNVFFENGRLSGVIDFYFACNDFFAYDLAICLNAWCFPRNQYQEELGKAMLEGYQANRPLSTAERQQGSVLCQGAAIRFLMTRLYDWINTPPDALVQKKDPNDYVRRLEFFQEKNVFL